MINDKTKKLEIAESNLFLIKGILNKLKEKNFDKYKSSFCTVMLRSPNISYCSQSIETIERIYSRNNWKCRMIHYYKSVKDKEFCYTFKFTKDDN